jgi:hypothetical protein
LGRERGAPHWPADVTRQTVFPTVIGDQEGAGFVDCHPDRSTARFAVRIEESRDDILGLAVQTPAAERHEDDLVAVEAIPVPTAMFADEGAAPVFLGKAVRRVECEPQRGHVGAQRIIGNDRLLDQIRTLRLDARVEMLAVIAVGPAVEAEPQIRTHIIMNVVWGFIFTESIFWHQMGWKGYNRNRIEAIVPVLSDAFVLSIGLATKPAGGVQRQIAGRG